MSSPCHSSPLLRLGGEWLCRSGQLSCLAQANCSSLSTGGCWQSAGVSAQWSLLTHKRGVRNNPFSGFPSFRRRPSAREARQLNKRVSPEVQRLLLRRILEEGEKTKRALSVLAARGCMQSLSVKLPQSAVLLSPEEIPSVAVVSSPELPSLKTSQISPLSGESSVLDRVALHFGDVCQLGVDAVLLGSPRTFSADCRGTGGKVFPKRDVFLNRFLDIYKRDSSPHLHAGSAREVVSAFLSAARTFGTEVLRTWPFPQSDFERASSNLSPLEVASALRLGVQKPGTDALMEETKTKTQSLSATTRLSASSVYVVPGLKLPCALRIHVVEPEALLKRDLLLKELLRTLEKERRTRGVAEAGEGERPLEDDAASRLSLLQRCYSRGLEVANATGASSLAIQLLGVGAAGFPVHFSAFAAASAVRRWLTHEKEKLALRRIVFWTCDDAEWHALNRNIRSRLISNS